MKSILKQTLFIFFISILLSCSKNIENPEEYIQDTIVLFNANDYASVVKRTNDLLELDPENYSLWTMQARSLFHLGHLRESYEAINKAIEINPQYFYAYGYRAIIKATSGRFDNTQILQDVNKALDHYPDNPDFLRVSVGLFWKSGDFQKAKEECERVLTIVPKDYHLNVMYATSLSRLGDFDEALKCYNKAIHIDSVQSYAYQDRGYTYLNAGKFNEAVADFNKIIDSSAETSVKAFAYNNRGYSFYKLDLNEKALKDIEQSLRLLPSNSFAYKNRALVNIKLNNLIQSCLDLNRAEELGYSKMYDSEVKELKEKYCD
ncbi:tetratricopeptide repeat protein [Flammeovirga sp. OC4]|uniref:tetratricopeptide repeat protein n=1 Tax=Flammeovirga sp. OC4 TaxID=1382345 RepID=UPI0005C59ABA|nr:tetratricopeptide repeat protein [Flammeovirga sp. OC4]